MMSGKDFQIGADLKVEYGGKTKNIEVLMKSVSGQRNFIPVEIPDANMKIQMTNLKASGEVNLLLSKLNGDQTAAAPREVLQVEASVKPFINLVWLGVLTLVSGFFISVVRRAKESNL
jgi:cytochrome c-type biogenesis protein CcmF